MNLKISALCLAMLSVGLVACNDDNDQSTPPVVEEATPESISLSLLGRYETGVFAESAAEIPAYDASTKRVFVVNAKKVWSMYLMCLSQMHLCILASSLHVKPWQSQK